MAQTSLGDVRNSEQRALASKSAISDLKKSFLGERMTKRPVVLQYTYDDSNLTTAPSTASLPKYPCARINHYQHQVLNEPLHHHVCRELTKVLNSDCLQPCPNVACRCRFHAILGSAAEVPWGVYKGESGGENTTQSSTRFDLTVQVTARRHSSQNEHLDTHFLQVAYRPLSSGMAPVTNERVLFNDVPAG